MHRKKRTFALPLRIETKNYFYYGKVCIKRKQLFIDNCEKRRNRLHIERRTLNQYLPPAAASKVSFNYKGLLSTDSYHFFY